jgi:aspartyl-tRNA(Asn)/glutamyl-tRNA(Gln) amidotransferase subunit C
MQNANSPRPRLHFALCILHYDRQVPTSLTIADVERIAALAQLELTDEEKRLFTTQLADILAYAEQVQAIDTSGVPATAHVNAAQRTEREDVPRPCLSVEDVLANAPDSAADAGLFRVPRVIGG